MEKQNHPQLLFKLTEAAKILGVSENMMKKLRADGRIPAIKDGRLVRYHIDDLKAWIEANRES